jgi:hypothetical protein
MQKAISIISACFLLAISQSVQSQESSGTPIKSLEEVLGFEPETDSATNRQGGAAKDNSLVIRDRESNFELYRPVFIDAVFFSNEQYRTDRSGWISAICMSPWDVEKSPAILLFDEEVRYVQVPYDQPDDLSWDEWDGRYFMRTPLAGHLLGAGYSVIIPVQKTHQLYRKIPPKDWVNLIDKFKKQKSIDENSFFLVATSEFAELAFKLAGLTDFAGVAIEEPSHLIFGNMRNTSQKPPEKRAQSQPEYITPPPPKDTAPQLRQFTPAVAQRYLGYFNRIKSPTLMIMAKDSAYAEFSSKTLLPALSKAGTDFRVIMLKEPARTLRSESDQKSTSSQIRWLEESQFEESGQTVGFTYDMEGMETWLARMLYFLGERTHTKPEPLPIPDPDIARQRLTESMMQTIGIQGLNSGSPFQSSGGNFGESDETGEGEEEP